MARILVVALIIGMIAPRVSSSEPRGSALPLSPFDTFAELATAVDRTAATSDVDEMWRRVEAAGTMPLVFGRTAVFLYRGPATTVEWRGDLDAWREGPTTHGERIGTTDIWWKVTQLVPGSRLDYKIVVDGNEWLIDPLNPHTQLGSYGPNSEVRMPGWQPPAEAMRRAGIPTGQLGERTPLKSKKLGYDVHYRIYLPAAADVPEGGFPLLVVTDGSDYWHDEMGSLVIILDNLIAGGQLPPIVAVFVDPWDRQSNHNRREQELIPVAPGVSPFLDFLTDELLPTVEAKHPVDGSGSRTAILGTSLGGLFATYAATTKADRFALAAIQSPAYLAAPWFLPTIEAARAHPARAFVDVGSYERFYVRHSRKAARMFEELGVEILMVEVPDGHSWGHWRATIGRGLVFLFSGRNDFRGGH